MGIPITDDDPINGDIPTCLTFVSDNLKVTVVFPLIGTFIGTIPRLPPPAENVWFGQFDGFPGSFVTVDIAGVNPSFRLSTFSPTVVHEFVNLGCDFPLLGTEPPSIEVKLEEV